MRPRQLPAPDRRLVAESPVRRRIRVLFPFLDPVTYAIAGGVLTAVWIGTSLLERLAEQLALLP